MTIRIGLNGHDPVLYFLSTLGILEPALDRIGVDVEWVPYAPGPRAPWLLGETLDFVGCGQTPMLHAHSDAIDAVYVASSPNRPLQGALVVPQNSDVRGPADLKNKRISFAVQAWPAQLVAGALGQVGLTIADVTTVVPDGDNDLKALRNNTIDAAVLLGPRLVQAEEAGLIRHLIPTDSAVCNRHLFTTTREFATSRTRELQIILTAMEQACDWVLNNFAEAARRRAHEVRYEAAHWGGDEHSWLQILQRMPWSITPIDSAFIDQQDHHAHLLHAAGVLAKPASAREYFLPELPWLVRAAVADAHAQLTGAR